MATTIRKRTTTTRKPRARRRVVKLPMSRATNAYQLVSDAVKEILAEPKRLNMRVVCEPASLFYREPPDCGTVGCFAGWITVLSGDHVVESNYEHANGRLDLAAGLVDLVTNKNPNGKVSMYTPTGHAIFGQAHHIPEHTGTPEYAKAVVQRHIRPWQKANARALKATKLVVKKGRLIRDGI